MLEILIIGILISAAIGAGSLYVVFHKPVPKLLPYTVEERADLISNLDTEREAAIASATSYLQIDRINAQYERDRKAIEDHK